MGVSCVRVPVPFRFGIRPVCVTFLREFRPLIEVLQHPIGCLRGITHRSPSSATHATRRLQSKRHTPVKGSNLPGHHPPQTDPM